MFMLVAVIGILVSCVVTQWHISDVYEEKTFVSTVVGKALFNLPPCCKITLRDGTVHEFEEAKYYFKYSIGQRFKYVRLVPKENLSIIQYYPIVPLTSWFGTILLMVLVSLYGGEKIEGS